MRHDAAGDLRRRGEVRWTDGYDDAHRKRRAQRLRKRGVGSCTALDLHGRGRGHSHSAHWGPDRGFASLAWTLVFCGVGRPSLGHPEKRPDRPHPPLAVKEDRRNSEAEVQHRRVFEFDSHARVAFSTSRSAVRHGSDGRIAESNVRNKGQTPHKRFRLRIRHPSAFVRHPTTQGLGLPARASAVSDNKMAGPCFVLDRVSDALPPP